MLFTSTAPVAGSTQALAAALVPAGLTPVAYFPATADQVIPALSVIFTEAIILKRKKRHQNEPFFNQIKRNFKRFTRLVKERDFNRLLRPSKFSTDPPNNLELILRFKDAHFGGLINITKNT